MNDDRTILYVEKDPVTLLGSRVRKHVLGTDAKDDPVVYEEADKSFYVGVTRAKSGQHILVSLRSTLVAEVLWASASNEALAFVPVSPREKNHEYNVDITAEDSVFLHTNFGAKNFRIVRTTLATCADKSTWRDVVAHDPNVFIEDFDVFRRVIAVNVRESGQLKVLVVSLENTADRAFVEADEKDFAMILFGRARSRREHPLRTRHSQTPRTSLRFSIP